MYLNMAHSDSFISHLFFSVSLSFFISAFSSLSDCISTFIWYSQNALVCCATFHHHHHSLNPPPPPQGKLHLPVSPKRRENCRFLSTAQQPSSPLGNNSTASLLVRTPLCHANCFVFLRLSLFQSIPSERKAVWSEKKGLFSPFHNSAFETVWAHADGENARSWWIYDYRVKGLGCPTGGFWACGVGSV